MAVLMTDRALFGWAETGSARGAYRSLLGNLPKAGNLSPAPDTRLVFDLTNLAYRHFEGFEDHFLFSALGTRFQCEMAVVAGAAVVLPPVAIVPASKRVVADIAQALGVMGNHRNFLIASILSSTSSVL